MIRQSDFGDDIADYVLGLLEGDARARFEDRMARDAALRAQVAALEDHLHGLDDTAEPDSVPEGLWSRIELALAAPVAPAAANSNKVVGVPKWAGMAAAVVLALGVGYFGGQLGTTAPEQPLMVAVLLSDDMAPGAIVEAFSDDSVRIVPLEALVAPEDSTLEVWTLPDVETGPVSLGTFQRAHELVLGGPDLPEPQADQLYEITLEPAGGSPTGRPTGPILLKGFARAPVI